MRRRWIRVFVGVELDNSVIDGLFTRNVARHSGDIGPEVTEHGVDCSRGPNLIQISKTALERGLGNIFPLRHFCTRFRCFVQKYHRANLDAKKITRRTCQTFDLPSFNLSPPGMFLARIFLEKWDTRDGSRR